MTAPESLTTELQDSDEEPGFDWSQFEWRRLLTPNALRRIGSMLVALAIVFWPGRGTTLLGRLIGIGLVIYTIPVLFVSIRSRPVAWVSAGIALVVTVVGGFLVIDPVGTEVALGRVLGLGLVVAGLRTLSTLQSGDRSDRGWRLTSALATISIGLLVSAFPSQLLSSLVAFAAIGWVVVELISISIIVSPDRDADAPRQDTLDLIEQWFEDRPKAMEDRQQLYREILYEGPRAQTKIIRFTMLMVFASVIASMGVVSDSTAVVVGAMLIAPLMTPLMAMALSLAMGWPRRLGRSALVALGGIGIAIAVGFIIGLADLTVVDTATNTQIISRSNPTLVDLVIAIAAGAAGSYALSRPDVSNSLPGVAIAIALVPPLTVVGISYSQRDWESGSGALLLFLTNAVAILVVGGLMFLLLGVAPLAQASANQHRVRTALAAVAGASALIVGALMLNGTNVASNLFERQTAERVVADWIEPFPDHTTVELSIASDTVSVVLAGPADVGAPRASSLAADLSDALGREISVDLRIRLETRERSG